MASEPSASGKNLDLADRSSFIDRFEIVLNDLDVALFHAISGHAAHKSEARRTTNFAEPPELLRKRD